MRILRITMFVLGFGALMPALLPTLKAEAATVTKGAVSSNHGGSRGATPGGTVSKGAVSPNKGAVSPNPGGGTGSGSGRRVVPYNGNHGGYGHGGYGRGYYGGYYGYRGYYPYYGYSPYYWGLGWGWGWGAYSPYYYAPSYYGYGGYGYGGYGGYGYGYGEVRTEVKPQQSEVFVDGEYAGQSDDFDGWWQGLYLPPGSYRLVFRAEGFTPYVVDLKVRPDGDYHLKYDMQPGQDIISEQEMRLERQEQGRNNGNRNYNQYRDDRNYQEDRYQDGGTNRDPYQGGTNGNRDPYQRPPQSDPNQGGDRNREYNGGNWEQQRPSQRNQGSAPPPPYQGDSTLQMESGKRQLTLQVQPTDATVYIDGTYYGSTGSGGNVEVLLPDGSHRVEVVRPGYESFEKDVMIGANSPSSLTVMLQKK